MNRNQLQKLALAVSPLLLLAGIAVGSGLSNDGPLPADPALIDFSLAHWNMGIPLRFSK